MRLGNISDVVQRGRTILLCVYDKQLPPKGGNLPSNGFLGAFIFEPPLVSDPGLDEMGLDVWVPYVSPSPLFACESLSDTLLSLTGCVIGDRLESAFDPEVGGEVRLRILYETIEVSLIPIFLVQLHPPLIM
jgi:protein-serine/threonine kinase